QRYHPDVVYDAAVLITLAAPDLHPGQALWLDDLVGICAQVVPKWKAARRKGKTPQLFAISTFNPQLRENVTEIRNKLPTEKNAVTIIVDLSLLWRTVEGSVRETGK